MLKMGETGAIACSKEFPFEDVHEYVRAYSLHKRKWFKMRHDTVSNIVYAERAKPPPWEKPIAIEEEEEL
jgi:hypothetical protein